MPCFSEEDQDPDVEELTKKNNSPPKKNLKYNLLKLLNQQRPLMLINQEAAQ